VRTTKRVQYTIGDTLPGGIFGHDEILLDMPRQTTAKTAEQTKVLYLNLEGFF